MGKGKKSILIINALLFLMMLLCVWYFRTNDHLLREPNYMTLYAFLFRPLLFFFCGSLIGGVVLCYVHFQKDGRGRRCLYWFAGVIGILGLLVVLISPIMVLKTSISFVVPLAKNVIAYTLFGILLMIGGNGLVRSSERRKK